MTSLLTMSFGGWFLLAVTVGLGLWALYMGVRGIAAYHPPFHEGGHAPGAKGTFDPAYEARTETRETMKAA